MDEGKGKPGMPKVLAGLGRFVDASELRSRAGEGVRLVKSANEFSADARRGMAVLGLAAVAVLALVYVIFSWHSSAADELRQASDQYRLVAARVAKAARDGATRLTAATDVRPMFLDGATPGLSAARFQTFAGDAASQAGLVVKRMQLMETGDEKASTPYRIAVDAEGSIEQLRAFLAGIEQSLPMMVVSGLELQPAAAEGAGDEYPSEQLRMSFRIDAYGWRSQP